MEIFPYPHKITSSKKRAHRHLLKEEPISQCMNRKRKSAEKCLNEIVDRTSQGKVNSASTWGYTDKMKISRMITSRSDFTNLIGLTPEGQVKFLQLTKAEEKIATHEFAPAEWNPERSCNAIKSATDAAVTTAAS